MAQTSVAATTGRPEIDALIGGTRWSDPTVTYGFASGAGDYQPGYQNNLPAGSQALGSAQQAAFRAATAEWSAVANVAFVETAAGIATVRVGVTSQTTTAFAYYPSANQEGGDVWISPGTAAAAATPGSYAYMTYIHELGHTLGLEHPHEGPNPGISDQVSYSVMSYRSYLNAPLTGYTVAEGSFATSPMLSDIAAVQAIYGANYGSHAGADTYRWTPGATVFKTVWDGGGTDTYDLSNFSTNLTVDLSPGGWTSFGGGLADLGDGQRPPGNVATAWLANGDTRALIENAVGGAGHDVIRGNVGANDLSGGLGDDTIYGGGAGDVIHGGAGNDVLYGGTGVNDPADAADTIFGDAGDDLIYGNGGADRIDAGEGSATVFGGYGSDTVAASIVPGAHVHLYGGSAASDPTDAADTLTVSGNGANGLAQLFGNGGDDALGASLSGNVRAEIYGGYGDDAIRLAAPDANASALVVAGPGSDDIVVATNGRATIYGGMSPADPTDAADRIDASGSLGRLEIYGNGGDDTIFGGGGRDTIHGGAGNDLIVGGPGADLLYGEAGADTFRIGWPGSPIAAADEIVGFEATDRLDLAAAGAGAAFAEVSAAVADAAGALAAAAGAFAAGALYVAVRSATDTYLLADTDGNHAGDWGVKLTGFTAHLDPAAQIV